MNEKISVIGGGNMGEALVKGLISEFKERSADIIVSDISSPRRKVLEERHHVLTTDSNVEAVKKTRIIILAVKPKDIDSVLLEIAQVLDERKLIISIAAGITTSHIEKKINKTRLYALCLICLR